MDGTTIGSKPIGRQINAVYDNQKKNEVAVDDFLQLMIAQLKNQDFMNPMNDTEYVTQLAQFSTMQQMQELAYYSKANYVMGLVGKEVTTARMSMGEMISEKGMVEKIALNNKEYVLYVNGKTYGLEQVMQVHHSPAQEVLPIEEVVQQDLPLINPGSIDPWIPETEEAVPQDELKSENPSLETEEVNETLNEGGQEDE